MQGKIKEFDAQLSDIMGKMGIEPAYENFLDSMVGQACDPANGAPNLALNLEICDMINKKKSTYARDAAFYIIRHLNRGNHITSNLALTLLDNCVKNCGYPFHLVVSSKDFLNQYVKSFPETPRNITSAQLKILEMLGEWNVTLAKNSRYKDDFKHINDMVRLLQYKGYRVPEPSSAAVIVTAPAGLKTEEELEAEDREKLENLLRLGTPAALAEANDLMKIMSGYDTSRVPDYKKQVSDELEQIESRVILFNDMLNQKAPGSFSRKDAAIEELHSSARSYSKKLMDFISTSDDEERMGRLLELNDLVNTVLQKYTDLKAGKTPAQTPFDRKTDASQSTASAGGFISLIDFDDAPVSSQPVKTPSSGLLDDLSSLQFGGTPQQYSQPAYQMGQIQQQDPFASLNQPVYQQQQQSDPFAALQQINQQKPQGQPMNTLQQNVFGVQQITGQPSLSSQPSFNNFIGQGLQTSSPALKPQAASFAPQNNDLLSLFDSPATVQLSNGGSLKNALPPFQKEFQIFAKAPLAIKLAVQSPQTLSTFSCQSFFVNSCAVPLSNLVFQIAVPKEPLKFRFKVQYVVNNTTISEQGEYTAVL